jgi:phospholipid N-methyltransferase
MSHSFTSFLISWLLNPRRVGAIAPSGRALAELITSEISRASAPVLELGPGTGIFTYSLLKRGLQQKDLTLVEYGSDFVRRLQLQFPGARVLWMDAARLNSVDLMGHNTCGAVVSGLPLLAMPGKKISAILGSVFELIREDGALYQFTYGPRCPVSDELLEEHRLEAELLGRVMRNLPPASVYRLRRRASDA